MKLIFSILFLLLGVLCIAQTHTSTGGGGDWNNPASWDIGVPATGADVVIASGDVITISGPVTNDDINSLTLEGTGNLDFTGNETIIVATSITMSGTSSITGSANTHRIDAGTFNIPSGTASIGGIRITISGLTTVIGTLSFTSVTGNKTFGDVTVTGTWDNSIVTEAFTFTGNLINNGTWNGCSDGVSCNYTMTSTTGALSGNGTFNITDLVINAPASLTNNGSVIMTDNITGTGTFINGATGILTLSDNGNYTVATLTLNTVGNNVIYAGATNEIINIGPFYDLEINMAATTNVCQINGSDVSIGNNLTITQGIVRMASANTLAVTGDVTISANGEFEANNVGAIANIGSDIIMTGGLYDHNNGDVNITDDFVISGATFTYTGTSTLDFDQMTVENTTILLSGGAITSTNAVADGITLNAGGILDIRAATVSVTSNINIANATAELTPNDVAAVLNVAGDILMSDGNYDHNNGDVNITDDFLITGGTFTYTGTSTLDFDQMTVENTTIVLSGGTITSTNAVADGITLNASGILNIGAATVNVTGNVNIANATAELTPNNVGAVLNVTGDILMSDGNYDHNNGDVNVSGDLIFTGGTMTLNESVNFATVDATDMTVTNTTVTLQEGILTLTNPVGGLTINAGSIVNVTTTHTLSITNDIIISGGEFTTGATGATTNIGGDLVVSSGEYDHNDGDVNISGDILISDTGLMNFSGATSTVDATDFTMTNGTANLSAGTMTISNAAGGMNINGGLVNVNGAHTLNVTNNLNIGGGEFQPGNIDMAANIGGNLTMSSGTFDQNDGDINITGDLIITGGIMTMNEGVTPGESTVDATDMSITAPGDVTLVEGTLTLSNAAGGLTVNSGNFSITNAAHTLSIAGDYDIAGGASDINLGTLSFVNMDINGGGTINVASPTISSTGLISVINGTFTIDGAAGTYNFHSLTVGAAGTWDVTAAYSPTFSGNFVNNGTFTGCNGTACVYTLTNNPGSFSGSSAMNAMGGLSITNSYTNTNSGGIDITQSLAGSTFINGTNGAMTYGGTNGNWTLTNFTANATGNTVTYNRTTNNQLLQPTTDNTYYNLTLAKAGQDLTTSSEITITNQLTLSTGHVILGGQNLVIGPSGSISGANVNAFIRANGGGNLRKITNSTGSFKAEIGGSFYAPITINLTSGGLIAGTSFIGFDITDNPHPNRDTDNTGAVPAGDDNGAGKPAANDYLNVYWTVVGSNITSPIYNADYEYTNYTFNGNDANMVGALYRDIGGTLDWLPRGTVNSVTDIVTFNDATAFGDLYAMDDTDQRLPIVLISFEAKAHDKAVVLKWATAAEENNQFFTIERSVNGVDFEPIIFVEGAGTTNDKMEYQAIDENPLLGRSYYKLKQTDFNGQFEYSEMVRVVFEGEDKFEFGLNRNPINQGESITIWKTTSLEGLNPLVTIRDIQGQELVRTNLSSLKDIEYLIPNTTGLSSGIYLLSVNYLGETHIKKVIVK